MAFALTKFVAFGVEAEEAVNKRYKQAVEFTITGLNSNVALDFGTYAGTFWTAVSGTEPGTSALKVIKEIQIKAHGFFKAGGSGIADKVQLDSTYPSVTSLDSTASSGGAATETINVTGLLTTDTILGVTQQTKGANSTALIGFPSTVSSSGVLGTAVWTANPGANAVLRVLVKRDVTTVQAGTYTLAMDATNTNIPNITFVTGDAPTSYTIFLEWLLKDGEVPSEYSAAA